MVPWIVIVAGLGVLAALGVWCLFEMAQHADRSDMDARRRERAREDAAIPLHSERPRHG
jgi:hypothetical protein